MNKSAILSVIFLVALFSYLIWEGYLELPGSRSNIDRAIPATSAFSFRIDDFSSTIELLQASKYKNDIEQFAWYKQLFEGLKVIQDLTTDDIDIPVSVVASYHYNKEQEGDFLFAISKKNIPRQPFKFFRKIVTNKEEIVETRKVGRTTMYSADVNAGGIVNITFANCKGITLFSNRAALVEQSLNRLYNSTLNGPFTKYTTQNTSIKTVQADLKLNFSNNTLTPSLSSNFDKLKKLNSKLYLFENGIITNGELEVEQNTRLSILAKHNTESYGSILEFIPAKTTYFEKYKVDNLLSYIEHNLENETIELYNSSTDFIQCLGNEWVNLKYDDSNIFSYVFTIEDNDKIESYLNTKNDKVQSFKNTEILKILGLVNSDENDFYCHIYKNILVLSSNKKVLNELMKNIKNKNNFSSTKAYKKYEPKLYKNNFCLVYNSKLKNNFGPSFYQFFTVGEAIFLNAVFGYKNEGLTNKVNFEYKPLVAKSKVSNDFGKLENLIGQKIINGPEVFTNHYTNQTEYVIQDDRNYVYLIDKKDSLLWQKKLDDPYLGKVNTIDYYKNNKLQILLNTKNKIYLIDRKGRDVESFPVTLSEKATNGITVVKYPDVNKIRYYLSTKSNILVAYDKNVKAVKGWKLPQLLNEVQLPVKHFVANNKDYLCAVTKNGTIHLFSRDGTPRQPPIETNLNDISTIETGERSIKVSNNKNTIKVDLK